jgi:hypothetical protein
MKLWVPMLVLAGLLVACATPTTSPTLAQDAAQSQPAPEADESDDGRGVGHVLLWYIPNRISDVLDIVRLRLRLGPGFAVGARVTELADFNLGGYTTLFVGIPGPRREREFNWPFGFESMAGAELSIFDGTASIGDGPNYGWLEVGLGTQLLLVGFDLGVDVWEVVDFATGIVCIDPVADDI